MVKTVDIDSQTAVVYDSLDNVIATFSGRPSVKIPDGWSVVQNPDQAVMDQSGDIDKWDNRFDR